MSGPVPPVRYYYCSPFTDEETEAGQGEALPLRWSVFPRHSHACRAVRVYKLMCTLKSTSAPSDTHRAAHSTAGHTCTHIQDCPFPHMCAWEHVCPCGLHSHLYPCAHRPHTFGHTSKSEERGSDKGEKSNTCLLPAP